MTVRFHPGFPGWVDAPAYNLANFLRTLALPQEVEHWSLTTSLFSWPKWRCRAEILRGSTGSGRDRYSHHMSAWRSTPGSAQERCARRALVNSLDGSAEPQTEGLAPPFIPR
jgi:hypothetical protein